MKTILILATILMVAAPHRAQQPSSSQRNLPRGNWTLACSPSRTRGSVVDLYMVGSDSSRGVTVTDVWLENRSGQAVAAVKIGWKLYEKSTPAKTLLSGETPHFLGVALAPGEKRVVTYPVVSFARIHGPLLRDGRVEGNFRIELWVTDVQFDSDAPAATNSAPLTLHNASWKTGSGASVLKVSSKAAAAGDDDFGCPNQECGWANLQNCYTCFNNQGSTCSWYNCSYCKSGRCAGLIE